ncbi:MAG: response regulator [Bacteroidota bacterium]
MQPNNLQDTKDFKVLIVDDVPENIQVLAHLLSEKGLKVNFADSGQKALKAIKNNLPDLILLDVSMPGMDGFQVCEKLKEDDLTTDIPVIFLTAKVDQQDVINGLEKGAVDYVTKPFNAKELISRVFNHLELKHSRDIIKQQNIELKRLNEVKNQLFSVISHDMKNLFNNILFGTESLEKEIGFFKQEDISQMAGMINDSAKRAYDLLQNLLDWSRSQMQNIKFKPVQVEILMLVKQVVSLLKPNASKKSIEVVIHASKDYYSAFADIEMTKTVLRNLLSNAIKYSKAESRIEITVDQNKDFVRLEVKDFGMGMRPEQMEKLRENDLNTQSTPGTQNEKGSGLGLVLVKDFVMKNNGSLGFDSKLGKGSVFWFELPRHE